MSPALGCCLASGKMLGIPSVLHAASGPHLTGFKVPREASAERFPRAAGSPRHEIGGEDTTHPRAALRCGCDKQNPLPRRFRGLCFDHCSYGVHPLPRFNFFASTAIQQVFVWPATSLSLFAFHAAPSSRADASVTSNGRLANPAPKAASRQPTSASSCPIPSSCRSAPTARRQPVTTTTHHRQATGSPRRRWSRPRLSSGRDSPRTRGSRSRRARASRGRWSGTTPPRRPTRRRLRRGGRGGARRAPRRRRPRPPRPRGPDRTRRRRPRRRN